MRRASRRSSTIWSRSAASGSFISPGPPGISTRDERAEALRRGLRRARRRASRSSQGDFEEESGERAVAELIESGQTFDAVFAGNDNMAIGALQALRRRGLRVPDDVAVAGFDDIPLARHLGLTTVRVRIAELGERALARLLVDARKSDDGGDELHAPELVIRTTTVQGAQR